MKVGDANRAKAKRLEGPHVGRRSGGTGQFLGGVRAMAPLAVGDVLDGVAFGALATAVLGKLAPVVFSATAFSGSAQYATVSVLRAHGTPAAALLAAAALNIRYLAMSASVTATLGGSRWRRALSCLLLTDAAWAVASAESGQRTTGARLVGAGVAELVAWTGGTPVGCLAGHALGNPARFGLDAAFPALFLWLLRDRIADHQALLAAVVGAAIAFALVPWLPPGVPILAAGLAAGA